jgi:hypothetical protein
MKPMKRLSSWSPKLQGRAVANMLIGLPAKGWLVPGIRAQPGVASSSG